MPYFAQPHLRLGPFDIYAFPVLLVIAVLTGRWIVLRRAARSGIDPAIPSRLTVVMLIAGLAGAHLVKIVMPDPGGFLRDPLSLVHRAGIASYGGLGGGLLAGCLWARKQRLSGGRILQLLDQIAWSLPFAFGIGRLGCALAHDHRGIPATNWFAVRFPEGTRWDLGLIEFFFLIALSAVFLYLDRRKHAAGFYFGLFGVSYGLFRIWLDTLHIQPLRFYGGAVACLIGLAGWWWSYGSSISGWSGDRHADR